MTTKTFTGFTPPMQPSSPPLDSSAGHATLTTGPNTFPTYLDRVSECPICRSSKLKPGISVHYWKECPIDFSDCGSCGASFANPMPTDEVISRGNNALVRHYQHDRTHEQEFREARRAYLKGRILGTKLDRWKKEGRFLELGCYSAFFSLGLKEHSSWSAEGLEISTELVNFITQTLGLQCHLGTLEESTIQNDQYDYIVCHDLIEHINNPTKFLKRLFEITAPGGHVELKTPNVHQDLAYSRRAHAAGIPVTMLLNHIMYFSPKALKTGLESVGFKMKKLYCYDVRYSLKDFGVMGLGKPVRDVPSPPEMAEALRLKEKRTLNYWNTEALDQLRGDLKVSALYGFIKEQIPNFFSAKVPYRLGVGHEIFALAEKPL